MNKTKILIIGGGDDLKEVIKQANEALKQVIEVGVELRELFELEPNCFDDLALQLKAIRTEFEYNKEEFFLKNNIPLKNYIVKNYRIQIRNQLPRKIRID